MRIIIIAVHFVTKDRQTNDMGGELGVVGPNGAKLTCLHPIMIKVCFTSVSSHQKIYLVVQFLHNPVFQSFHQANKSHIQFA